MSFSTIRVTVGRVFLVAGVLVLLFIPYLLWGTGLITARAQSRAAPGSSPPHNAIHAQVGLHHRHRPDGPAHRSPGSIGRARRSGARSASSPSPRSRCRWSSIEGTGTDQLRSGPGHYPGTPLPGEPGNVAIAGHRTTYLHPFYSLNELVPGDAIDILTVQGSSSTR